VPLFRKDDVFGLNLRSENFGSFGDQYINLCHGCPHGIAILTGNGLWTGWLISTGKIYTCHVAYACDPVIVRNALLFFRTGFH
jgi:hypothetical protein